MELLITNYLTKIYGFGGTVVKALKPTDLVLQKVEFIAIVGSSSLGKSTLLHLPVEITEDKKVNQ